MEPMKKVSIVIPCRNEVENVEPISAGGHRADGEKPRAVCV